MPRLAQITPFLLVTDLEAAAQFFRDSLGFKLLVRYDDYAYLQRDSAGIRLLQSHRAPGSAHAYLDVEAVDALWAEFRSTLNEELRNNPDGPRNQTYGQREFTVFGPEGITLFFGEEILPDQPAGERARHEDDPPEKGLSVEPQ